MKQRSDTSWRYQGSTLLFSGDAIATLLSDHLDNSNRVMLIPLRVGLCWASGQWPTNIAAHTTCMITGLESLLQTAPQGGAEQLLIKRVRPMIRAINKRWPQVGLVFPFPVDPSSLDTNFEEEILLRQSKGTPISLSGSLWGGSVDAITELSSPAGRIGYHVSHLS